MMFDIEADIIRLMEQFAVPQKISPDEFRHSIDSIYSSYPNNGFEVSQFLLKELCINYFQFMKNHQASNNITTSAQSTSTLNDTEDRFKSQNIGCQSFSTVDSHESQNCANDVDYLPSSLKVRYVSQKPSLLGKIPLPTRQEISIDEDEVPLSSRSSSICVDSASDVPSQSSRDSESSSNDCEAEDQTAEEGWREALGDRIEGDHTHFDLFRALMSSMKENKPKSSVSQKSSIGKKTTTKKKKNTSIENKWSQQIMSSSANEILFEEDENEEDDSDTHGLTVGSSMRMPLTTEMLQNSKHSGGVKTAATSSSFPSPQRFETKTKIRSHSYDPLNGNPLDGNTSRSSSSATKMNKDKTSTTHNNNRADNLFQISEPSSHWNTTVEPTTSTISHKQSAIVVAANNPKTSTTTTAATNINNRHHATSSSALSRTFLATPSNINSNSNSGSNRGGSEASVDEHTTATVDDALSFSPTTLRGKIAHIICEEMTRHQSDKKVQHRPAANSSSSSSSSHGSHAECAGTIFSELLLNQIGSSLLTVLLSEATLYSATTPSASPFSPLLLPSGLGLGVGLGVGGVGGGGDAESEERDLSIALLLQKSIKSVLSIFIGFNADPEHTKLLMQMLASTLESLVGKSQTNTQTQTFDDSTLSLPTDQQLLLQQHFTTSTSCANTRPSPVHLNSSRRANQYLLNDNSITTTSNRNNNNKFMLNLPVDYYSSQTGGSPFSTSASSIITSIKDKANTLLKEFDHTVSSSGGDGDGDGDDFNDDDDYDSNSNSSSSRWRSDLWDDYMEGKEFTAATSLPPPPFYLTADCSDIGGPASLPFSSPSTTHMMMQELAGDPDGDILPTATSSATAWSPPIPPLSHVSGAASQYPTKPTPPATNTWKSFNIAAEMAPDYSTVSSKRSSSPLFPEDRDSGIGSTISHSSPVDIFRNEDASRLSLDPLFAIPPTVAPPSTTPYPSPASASAYYSYSPSTRSRPRMQEKETASDSKLLRQLRRDHAAAATDTPPPTATAATSYSARKSMAETIAERSVTSQSIRSGSGTRKDILEKYKNQFRNDKLQRAEEAIALSLSFIETAEKLKKKKNTKSKLSK